MADRKFKVGDGDEIVIKLPGKKISGDDALGRGRRKGMIRSRRPDNILPRRLKKDGLLNFYYLGERKTDGVFGDLDFILQTPINQENTGGIIHYPGEPTLAEWETLITKIFETEANQWTEVYRKLDQENVNKYGLELLIDDEQIVFDETNENWSPDGLKVKNAAQLSLFGNRHPFFCFDTDDGENVKVTDEFDYEAPQVALNLSGEANVFLVPLIGYMAASGSTVNPGHTELISDYFHWVGGFFRPFPTEKFLQFGAFGYVPYNPSFHFDFESDELANYWLDWLKAEPLARHRKQWGKLATTGSPAEYYEAGEPVSAFPSAPILNVGYYSGNASPVRIKLGIGGLGGVSYFYKGVTQIYPGKLMAIVQNKNRMFYIWSKTDDFSVVRIEREYEGVQEFDW